MDVRQFFTHQSWWGKLLGAGFGFLTAGPIGALSGLLIGNFFDKGLYDYFSKPYGAYLSEKNQHTKALFMQALFSLLGHIAKSKGVISKAAIQMAETVMEDMGLDASEQQAAKAYFHQGKQPTFYQERARLLIKLKQTLAFNRPLFQRFLNTLYQALQLEGPSTASIQLMNAILNELDLAPMHKQHPFFSAVDPLFTEHVFQHRYTPPPFTPPPSLHPLEEAYQTLELTPTATAQEVKRAYRRLMSQHHPDKRIAKGASEAEIKAANDKTQRIRKAYEKILQQLK